MQRKTLQEGQKITYKHVAEGSGVAENTLTKIVNNRVSPSADTIEKLCRYFQCTPNDLMEIMDDPK